MSTKAVSLDFPRTLHAQVHQPVHAHHCGNTASYFSLPGRSAHEKQAKSRPQELIDKDLNSREDRRLTYPVKAELDEQVLSSAR